MEGFADGSRNADLAEGEAGEDDVESFLGELVHRRGFHGGFTGGGGLDFGLD